MKRKLYAEWNVRLDKIRKLVETVPGVSTSTYVPDDGNRYPTLRVTWDQQAWGFSISDCGARTSRQRSHHRSVGRGQSQLGDRGVREGNPNSKVRKAPDHIELVSMTIKPGEEMIVGQRLRAVLAAAWKKAA